MKLILDTNFVFIPFTYKVDIITQIEHIIPAKVTFVVMQKTMDELEKLCNLRVSNAKGAFAFCQKYCTILTHADAKTADDAIVTYCQTHSDTIVATQDLQLKKRLQEIGIRIVVLRQKSHLTLIEV